MPSTARILGSLFLFSPLLAVGVALGQAPEGDDAQTPTIAGRLRASLLNDPQLQGARVVFAQRTSDGVVHVSGFLADEAQRARVEQQGLVVLQREEAANNLAGPFTKVDASQMQVVSGQPSPLDYLTVVDQLLGRGAEPIAVQQYDPQRSELTLCGIVSTDARRQALVAGLRGLENVKTVRINQVLVADELAFAGSTGFEYDDCMDALTGQQGPQVVNLADTMLRRGRIESRIWYLRAAGHLLAGRTEQAVGDLRVAQLMDSRDAPSAQGRPSPRFAALRKFQGTHRLTLERLIAQGRASCLPPARK